ncbi:DNA/RNA-binding protein KIN17 domain-containing protein [Cryptosporidium felis]|nr:DNA/RNA-binding protein KIN17 domain-containing protein [Cryptosporidium felis]
MPKAEVGTVKWASKQIKLRGLQKLRWYCQLCEKQCRDENGYKCHRMSDAHLRQMELFDKNSQKMMYEFSKQFEAAFMKLMRTRYSKTKVLANTVYNDVIHDRNHIHMNATKWTTLTEFIHYLSNTNKCTIENSDKGWYIQYKDQRGMNMNSKTKDMFGISEDQKREERISIAIGSGEVSDNRGQSTQKLSTAFLRGSNEHDKRLLFELNHSYKPNKLHENTSIRRFFYLDEQGVDILGSEKCLGIHTSGNESSERKRESSLSRDGY